MQRDVDSAVVIVLELGVDDVRTAADKLADVEAEAVAHDAGHGDGESDRYLDDAFLRAHI